MIGATRILGSDTCVAGPWCDKPTPRVDREGTSRLCDGHRQQKLRGIPLKPLEGTLEASLQRMVPMPDLRKAACGEADFDFTSIGTATQRKAAEAAEYCAGCPVLDECREYADSTREGSGRGQGDPWPVRGVWGGVWYPINRDRPARELLADDLAVAA